MHAMNKAAQPESASQTATQVSVRDEDFWAQRRAGNVRLAWGMVGFVLMVFVIALWKYRPL